MKEAIEFRPTPPHLRDVAPTLFLAALLLILVTQRWVRGADISPLGIAGLTFLVAGGTWLALRGRWPGRPRLCVDYTGMRYRVGRTERSLRWEDVEAIEVDFTLDRMRFIPKGADRAISMRPGMVAEDGRAWLGLIEEYWKLPDALGQDGSC